MVVPPPDRGCSLPTTADDTFPTQPSKIHVSLSFDANPSGTATIELRPPSPPPAPATIELRPLSQPPPPPPWKRSSTPTPLTTSKAPNDTVMIKHRKPPPWTQPSAPTPLTTSKAPNDRKPPPWTQWSAPTPLVLPKGTLKTLAIPVFHDSKPPPPKSTIIIPVLNAPTMGFSPRKKVATATDRYSNNTSSKPQQRQEARVLKPRRKTSPTSAQRTTAVKLEQHEANQQQEATASVQRTTAVGCEQHEATEQQDATASTTAAEQHEANRQQDATTSTTASAPDFDEIGDIELTRFFERKKRKLRKRSGVSEDPYGS